MSRELADAMRVLLQAYSAAVYSDTKVGEDIEELCARQALEKFEARTFATDCHELADRCTAIYRSNTGLRPAERATLRTLALVAHYVGDDAGCAPDLYPEPR